MKRYEEMTVLRFYIELEHPDMVAEIQDDPDVMEQIAHKLYSVAHKRGQVQGDDYPPPRTRFYIMETTPYIVVRMIIPPRLV